MNLCSEATKNPKQSNIFFKKKVAIWVLLKLDLPNLHSVHGNS